MIAIPTKKSPAMSWQLTKRDTTLLKGLAIAAIVLHNFFHVFPSLNIENEFDFKFERFTYFSNNLSWSPFKMVPLLFSYFGHFGVQIFIFLSAYGLSVSTRNKKIIFEKFIWNRISNLYPAFFIAVCMLIALILFTTPNIINADFLFYCFLRLTLISNFFPGQSFNPCGPWWFYSMIVQFYMLFPVLKYLLNRYGTMPLILLSLISVSLQLTFNNVLIEKGWFIGTTVFGHIPLLSLGLYFGKKERIHIPVGLFFIACLVFFLGNLYEPLWYVSQVSMTLILLFAYFFLKEALQNLPRATVSKFIFFIGTISMYLFAVNGFLRHPFVQKIQNSQSEYKQLFIVVLYFPFVILIALVLRFFEKQLLYVIDKFKKSVFTKYKPKEDESSTQIIVSKKLLIPKE